MSPACTHTFTESVSGRFTEPTSRLANGLGECLLDLLFAQHNRVRVSDKVAQAAMQL